MCAVRARAASVLVALLSMVGPAAALDPERPLSMHDERVFGVREGLPQATVNAIAQTPDGYLWLGTDGGLARYDGRRFTVFRSENTPALRIHRILMLFVDRAGALWIGTGGGAGLLRLQAGRFETFEQSVGIGGNVASAAQDGRGDLWFGTPHGLIRRRGGTFTRVSDIQGRPLGAVASLAVDAAGGLWVGEEFGLHVIRGEEKRTVLDAAGLALAPYPRVHADRAGIVWVSAPGGELLRHEGGSFVRVARRPSEKTRALTYAALHDRGGGVWLAGEEGLAAHRKGAWHLPPPGSSLRFPLLALFEDREGNLWAGTRSQGVVRVSHGVFATLPLENAGRTLVVRGGRDGELWAGTIGGDLLRIRDDVSRWPAVAGLDAIYALAADDAGGVWAGGGTAGEARLAHLDRNGKTQKVFTLGDGLPRGAVVALARMPDDELWVGTTAGLFRVTGARLSPGPAEVAGAAIYAIHRDRRGRLWLADGSGRGVHLNEGGRWRLLPRDQLSNGQVFAIDEDEGGDLWFGTLTGFSRWSVGKTTRWRLATGFRDDPVFKVIPDSGGNLWLCTTSGILRVSRQALSDHQAHPGRGLRYTRYDDEDGLPGGRCGEAPWNAGWRAPSGEIWVPSGHTLARVDPARLPPTVSSAAPLVESIALDGRTVDRGQLSALPPGRGDLEIAYTAPLLTHADRLRFRYRLDPFDAGWVEAGDRRVAYYTKLPPGRYRFRVAVEGEDGEPSTTTALALTLSPRLDQTWWFRGLLALLAAAALLLLVLSLHRRRLRELEARHRVVLAERTRISRELHDTLAQGFTGISVNLEAAQGWMDKDTSRVRESLDRARALVRSSLADARRAVWDMAPEAVSRGGLLEALAEATRGLGAEVAVRTQINGAPRPLAPAVERAVARIGQESLTNAVRHAGANNISLELSFTDADVHLKVSDDGRGFDPAAAGPSGHMGLANLRARAAEIGAALDIQSRPGGGTVVTLRAPAPKASSA